MPRRRKLLWALLVWTALLGGCEVCARVWHSRGRATPAVEGDGALGWHLASRDADEGAISRCGEPAPRRAGGPPFLLREPAPGDKGPRVLFIGDSFTHALQVASGSAFYDVFAAQSGGARVWAAGVSGYGSTQEALMLEAVFDQVRPEVVVWQTLSNDIDGDNTPELDAKSVYRAPSRPRPYLDLATGEIAVREPPFPLLRHSVLCRKLYRTLYRAGSARGWQLTKRLDRLWAPDAARHAELEEHELRVLAWHLRQAMAAHPTVRFVGFSADTDFEPRLRAVFEEAGATWIPDVAAQVAAEGTVDCRPIDFHWNHLGHRAAGELLARHLLR